ncbi:hypothetical protein [Mariniradius sediminis]|uniref:Asparagine synthase (Glutamine-hydrolysing) n=1 Tax=Mariniradius sediminis TaxID=2909237 RepID=A0ABS9BT80_9BACT|nr:hypothetical protein [Mariniradius sediminis]MCF1750128.1 hypothetical protein [Mariniradius sediminis]
MSKIIWIYSRIEFQNRTKDKLNEICSFLTPDNLVPNPHKIHLNGKCAYGILNPKNNISFKNDSVSLGVFFGNCENWSSPGTEVPDGNFALFRSNENMSEIITDVSASRTIWYYFNDEVFIASTSQFAITKYIDSFVINRLVIPWMLTTGTLGPGNSWDERIKKMPPNSLLTLNHSNWSIELFTEQIPFGNPKSKEIGQEELNEKIFESFRSIDLGGVNWTLPLSGGYDSRGILFYLKSTIDEKIKTITWGLPDSIEDRTSDAYIAKRLTDLLDVSNNFVKTDFSQETFQIIFERFVKNGEGRIDHISGYLDGFKIWNDLHEGGIDLIIRGDENFGWHSAATEKDVLSTLGISYYNEYPFLKEHLERYSFIQELPQSLKKRSEETIPQWRDRLYHQYRLQNLISCLGELKCSYVEQIVPLLTKNILKATYLMPDENRTNKIVWRKIVEGFEPRIEFASSAAIANTENIFHSEKVVSFLKAYLSSHKNNEMFDEGFMNEIIRNVRHNEKTLTHIQKLTFKKFIKKFIPDKVYSKIKNEFQIKRDIDPNVLAFRVCIIIFINELLRN